MKRRLFSILLICTIPTLSQAEEKAVETDESNQVVKAEKTEESKAIEEPEKAAETETAVKTETAVETEAAVETETAEEPEEDEISHKYMNKEYVDAILESSSHVSLGYALGRLGDGLALGPRLDIPIGSIFFLRVHAAFNFGPFESPFDPVVSGGIGFMFRSDVFFGIFRLYGGGGPTVFWRPLPSQCDTTKMILRSPDCEETAFTPGGGGYAGIEFFADEVRAFFIEIGGAAGGQKNGLWKDTGATMVAGNQFYF